MIAVVIPTCNHHYIPPDYGTIPVIVVHDDQRRGFAASSNIGIAKAQAQGCQWVVICNDDIALSLSDLQEMISQVQEDTGAISPLIEDDQGIKYSGIMVSNWGRVRMIRAAESRKPDSAFGTCMMIPSWARFDAQYLHGFEDIALCSLLRKRGRTITTCRSARCRHDGGSTIAHHTRSWFARSIYGQLRFYSSPALSVVIVGLGFAQARSSFENIKGVWDGYLLWKRQRSSSTT